MKYHAFVNMNPRGGLGLFNHRQNKNLVSISWGVDN